MKKKTYSGAPSNQMPGSINSLPSHIKSFPLIQNKTYKTSFKTKRGRVDMHALQQVKTTTHLLKQAGEDIQQSSGKSRQRDRHDQNQAAAAL